MRSYVEGHAKGYLRHLFRPSLVGLVIVGLTAGAGCGNGSNSNGSNSNVNYSSVAAPGASTAADGLKAGGSNNSNPNANGSNAGSPNAETSTTGTPTAGTPVNGTPMNGTPTAEASAIRNVTFRSDALKKDMRFNIYLPKGYSDKQKYPVLYLIHGLGSTETMWFPDLGMEKTADKLIDEGKIKSLIMVAPQIDNSYGYNSFSARYGDYLTEDLIGYVDSHFSTDARRESRYIGGLSMGGWAALHNAFTHPELFGKVGGHSPALWMDDWSIGGSDLRFMLYPDDEVRKLRDPLKLAETEDLSGLSVYLDCGAQDENKFYEGTAALFRKLRDRKVKVEYHPFTGKHSDAYWREHEADYLLFYDGK